MFSTADLKALDPKYFSVIAVDDYDVTIMSRNTGHIWYIHNLEYPKPRSRIIFHKHSIPHSYHQHRKAVKSIKKHDWQQMGGKIKLL